MAMALYDSVDGVARKVTKKYDSVDGVARKVTKCYDSVGGVARQYFSAGAKFSRVSGWKINYFDDSSVTSGDTMMSITGDNFFFTDEQMTFWFDCYHHCAANLETEHWEGAVYLIRDADGYYIGVHPDDNPEGAAQFYAESNYFYYDEEFGDVAMAPAWWSQIELLNPDTFVNGYLEIRVTCDYGCGGATIRITFE